MVRREGHPVSPARDIRVDRVLFLAEGPVAEGPVPFRDRAGRQVRELHGKRSRAGTEVCRELYYGDDNR